MYFEFFGKCLVFFLTNIDRDNIPNSGTYVYMEFNP